MNEQKYYIFETAYDAVIIEEHFHLESGQNF